MTIDALVSWKHLSEQLWTTELWTLTLNHRSDGNGDPDLIKLSIYLHNMSVLFPCFSNECLRTQTCTITFLSFVMYTTNNFISSGDVCHSVFATLILHVTYWQQTGVRFFSLIDLGLHWPHSPYMRSMLSFNYLFSVSIAAGLTEHVKSLKALNINFTPASNAD